MSQADFAEKVMLVSRDYLSQIENGREPSDRLKQQIELLEKVGIERPANADSVRIEESAAPYGSPETMRREIRSIVETSIEMAGDDVSRLGWLREQAAGFMRAPAHWQTLDETNARAVELAKRLKAERQSHGADARGTRQA